MIFDGTQIATRRGYEDLNVTEWGKNREAMVRFSEITQDIVVNGKSYLPRTTLDIQGLNRAGQEFSALNQIVISKDVNIYKKRGAY